jgi:hypothetical protein
MSLSSSLTVNPLQPATNAVKVQCRGGVNNPEEISYVANVGTTSRFDTIDVNTIAPGYVAQGILGTTVVFTSTVAATTSTAAGSTFSGGVAIGKNLIVGTTISGTGITLAQGANPNVTQLTSNTTAVATTGTTGVITMEAVAASGTTAFIMTNPNINANSNVTAWSNAISATTFDPVVVTTGTIAAGTVTITVNNVDASHSTITAPHVYYLIL